MKTLLLYFAIIGLHTVSVPANALSGSDTTTVIIENSTDRSVTIQREYSPHYLIGEYRKLQKTDTLKIVSPVPFRLIFSEMDADKQYVYKTFWLNPNEEVHITQSPQNIKAYSTLGRVRTNELNFFTKMQDSTGNFEGLLTYIPHKRKDPVDLLNKVQEIYQRRIHFLNEYKKQNPISADYESVVRNIVYYRQYAEFLDHCHLDGMLNKQLLNSEEVSLFISDFSNQKEDADNIYFLEARKWLSKLHYLEGENYFKHYFTLKEFHTGYVLDYLSVEILDWAVGNASFSQLFEDFIKSAKSEELKKYVTANYGEFLASDLEIEKPAGQGDQTLFYHLKSKKTITWEELLKTDGVKYLDFWASWCGGCRASMPKVKELQAELKNKNFKVIYISIDEKSGVWENTSKKENLPDENSYLMLNPDISKVKKDYNISVIPRYMIVNSSGKLTNISAPNVYNPGLKEELKPLLD